MSTFLHPHPHHYHPRSPHLIPSLFLLHMRIRRRPQLRPCPATLLPSSSSTTTTLPASQPREVPQRGGDEEEEGEDGKKKSWVEEKGDADHGTTEGGELVSLRHYGDLPVPEIQNGCTPLQSLTDPPSSDHLHQKSTLVMGAGPNHDHGFTNIKVQQKQQEQGTQDSLFIVEETHKNNRPWCKNTQGFNSGNKWDDEKSKSSAVRGTAATTSSTATSGVINIGDRHGSENPKSRKRRGNPAVLMEGSRCSRVNGRGWRCCQQTLVGYSLCEHHLGKGRLRSMSNAKSKGKKNKGGTDENNKEIKGEVVVEEEEENVGLRMKGKKMGMVKAKSISSLLLAQIAEEEVLTSNGNESRCSGSNSRSNLKITA